MKPMIKPFHELSTKEQASAGGKGGTLAKLIQRGYPVPDGFVILPGAFENQDLTPDSWHNVRNNLNRLRAGNGKTAFAVRSSAMAEDSAYASFAGEFETVLDVHTDEAVRAAICEVYQSRQAERVRAYSRAKGLEEEQEIAVVVQKLVRADISGILFTADPVTGSRLTMAGNYIYGLGEGLVSGEVEPYTFTFQCPKGQYEGPDALKRYAKALFRMAKKLETDLGQPQDIEWAIADGDVYLLQSRPITTLIEYNTLTGEYNSSLTGDFLWIGNEVFPDVMTPSTYSMFRTFHNYSIAGLRFTGNICGRFYMNYSMMKTLMWAYWQNEDRIQEQIALTSGFDLSKVTSPKVPVNRWEMITGMLPIQFNLLPMQNRLMKRFDEIIQGNPKKCSQLRIELDNCQKKENLIDFWHEKVFPLFYDLLMIQDKANEDYFFPYMSARKQLKKLMGEAKADELLVSLISGSGELTSLGPTLGVIKVIRGEMSRERYTTLAGHRLLEEDELLIPRPYENPDWIEQRIAEYKANPVDYDALLAKREAEIDQAWGKFSLEYAKQAHGIKKKLDKIAEKMAKREIIRSELTRSIGVVRTWFLNAGRLTGLEDGIFFLEIEEVLALLAGDESKVQFIPNRRQTYENQKALPKYPMVISGRFDPYTWTKDPDRRADLFDSHAPIKVEEDTDTIYGQPGSTGVVEGTVRIVHSPAESDAFQPGEILVASSTNVGWTPLFPKAAAVITDVGAPLSHAAIVARELGIPAVVGTGNAATLLKTGDRVLVDGGHGIVKRIK